jgi:hypothetical protein
MFYHTAFTHRVDWNPEYDAETEEAEQAMSEIVADFNTKADAPVKVDYETALAVKARYRELIEANPDIQTE